MIIKISFKFKIPMKSYCIKKKHPICQMQHWDRCSLEEDKNKMTFLFWHPVSILTGGGGHILYFTEAACDQTLAPFKRRMCADTQAMNRGSFLRSEASLLCQRRRLPEMSRPVLSFMDLTARGDTVTHKYCTPADPVTSGGGGRGWGRNERIIPVCFQQWLVGLWT